MPGRAPDALRAPLRTMAPPQYSPNRFPPRFLDWAELLPQIGAARAAIAGYEGVLEGVPNPDILLAPLAGQEAVVSSRIEGTRSSLSEVLAVDAGAGEETQEDPRSADAREVLNYRLALGAAVRLLERLPLSQRLIRETHGVLMRGARGGSADPGQYRRVANWIGPPGSTEATATFVTCPVHQIPDAMTAWERYLHSDTPDALVQLAVLHAWFEAVHPFLDGNGRLGRLMFPLFLVSRGLLRRPDFYLSEVLERYRDDYYRHLLEAQSGGAWSPWLRFFLTAVEQQAVAHAGKARRILALYRDRKDWIADTTRSRYGVRALDFFFERPVFWTSSFYRRSEIPKPTALRLLRVLQDERMLRELRPARGRRPALLSFRDLITIVEQRSDFGA